MAKIASETLTYGSLTFEVDPENEDLKLRVGGRSANTLYDGAVNGAYENYGKTLRKAGLVQDEADKWQAGIERSTRRMCKDAEWTVTVAQVEAEDGTVTVKWQARDKARTGRRANVSAATG